MSRCRLPCHQLSMCSRWDFSGRWASDEYVHILVSRSSYFCLFGALILGERAINSFPIPSMKLRNARPWCGRPETHKAKSMHDHPPWVKPSHTYIVKFSRISPRRKLYLWTSRINGMHILSETEKIICPYLLFFSWYKFISFAYGLCFFFPPVQDGVKKKKVAEW